MELSEQLKKASYLRDQLAQLSGELLQDNLNSLERQIEAVDSLGEMRAEVVDYINRMRAMPGFQTEQGHEILTFASEVVNVPLFTEEYEQVLEEQANAANTKEMLQNWQIDLQSQIADYYATPYPGEQRALQALYEAHGTPCEEAQQAKEAYDLPLLYCLLPEPTQAKVNQELIRDGLSLQISRLEDTHSTLVDIELEDSPLETEESVLGLQGAVASLRDALRESLAQGKPTTELKEMKEEWMEAAEQVDELFEGMGAMADMLGISEEEMMDMFMEGNDWGGEDWAEISGTPMPTGTPVSINAKVWPELDQFGVKTTEGWQGWVTGVFSNGEVEVWEVQLDSTTLRGLPKEYIQTLCEEDVPHFNRYEFRETELDPAEPRDTEAEADLAYKELFNRYFWGDPRDEDAQRMFNILMANPMATDLDNWEHFFRESITYPFSASINSLLPLLLPNGTPATVLGVAEEAQGVEEGLLMNIEVNGEEMGYPLVELVATDENSPQGIALGDYLYWSDYCL